jgi:hypothetical protein
MPHIRLSARGQPEDKQADTAPAYEANQQLHKAATHAKQKVTHMNLPWAMLNVGYVEATLAARHTVLVGTIQTLLWGSVKHTVPFCIQRSVPVIAVPWAVLDRRPWVADRRLADSAYSMSDSLAWICVDGAAHALQKSRQRGAHYSTFSLFQTREKVKYWTRRRNSLCPPYLHFDNRPTFSLFHFFTPPASRISPIFHRHCSPRIARTCGIMGLVGASRRRASVPLARSTEQARRLLYGTPLVSPRRRHLVLRGVVWRATSSSALLPSGVRAHGISSC